MGVHDHVETSEAGGGVGARIVSGAVGMVPLCQLGESLLCVRRGAFMPEDLVRGGILERGPTVAAQGGAGATTRTSASEGAGT